ncbi:MULTISPECIES: hypothetical protein [unclassified Variovorax]|jgi:hypothetical protein|uniref:hypothetical protein n=1 Tax=unclassified Variovorax TaxID=663243 RepID=UPI00116053C4|nr:MULTISPECIES: hypothetical protein [unclassified Variovorax]
MKPDSNTPGYPFNFDAIPHWVEPELLDFNALIKFRKTKIVCLYALSCAIGGAWVIFLGYLLIGLLHEFTKEWAFAFFVFWAIASSIFAPLFGLAVLWDFTKAKEKYEITSAEKIDLENN